MIKNVRSLGVLPDCSVDCSTLVNAAILTDDILFKDGDYLLGSAIIIPSNRNVYIENARLKMADGSYDNFFRNADLSNGNTNIKIIGKNAALDGNTVNNDDDYVTHGGVDGLLSYKYSGICFSKVSNFEIGGIDFIDRMHFGIYIYKSYSGSIHDIYLDFKTVTLNQDSIAFTWGSHDITVSNIKAWGTDDFSICAAGDKADFCPTRGTTGWNVGDIYNISYDNIIIYTLKHPDYNNGQVFPILCGDGNKVHDNIMNNVTVYQAYCLLSTAYPTFRTIPPAVGDVCNITMDNILVHTSYLSLLRFEDNINHIRVTDLTNNSGKSIAEKVGTPTVTDVIVNGVTIYG